MIPNIAISDDFLIAYSKIPQSQQKKVREFAIHFKANPTAASINFEPIHNVLDKRVRTVRIGLDYRAVILQPEEGDVYLLVWVDHHDEAMKWAKNKQFGVNPVTGSFQIINTQIVQDSKRSERISHQTGIQADVTLFGTFSNDDLLKTGLPEILLPTVRALRNSKDLDNLKPYLPEESFEALYWIANLGYSVDQALGEVGIPTSVDPKDVTKALNHPDSKRRFVVVKNVDELVEILNAPLAKWRIFLHPSQASLVSKHFTGSARVLGGAGTGKTVVAMHRAHYLATQVFTKSTEMILFTTFSRTLASNIRENLKSLCGPELDRIEVVHLHSWAANYLKSRGIKFEIASQEEKNQCWRDAFSAIGTGEWNEAFYKNEWDRVVQVQGINNREEYLLAQRLGQRVRLTRPQRSMVWEVFDEYKRNLNILGKLEWIDIIRQTRLYLTNKGTVLPYKAIIIDETQDLHPEDLKLIRMIVPEGPNDLFFVGDAHQRIYGRPVVMGQCGINIKGRSSKLRINYRTTEEIRNWSLGVLNNRDIDDLDGGNDTNQDYRSLLHGEPPAICNFPSLVQEKKFINEMITKLLSFVNPETICLVTRTNNQLLNDYIPGLLNAKIDYLLLKTDTPENEGGGIRLATMHRVKGLEFQHVIIAGVNAGIIPWESNQNLDESELYDSELQERCLFHVASTRARDTLTITSYGIKSRFIADLPPDK